MLHLKPEVADLSVQIHRRRILRELLVADLHTSEDGGRRTEDGVRMAEDGGRRTEGGGRRAEHGGRRTEDG